MPSGLHPPVSALVRRLVAAGLLVFFGLGCDSTGPEDAADAPPPRPLTAAEDQVVDADNAFGLTLLRSTVDTEGTAKNVFLSPISVSMALGMALNGARGETRSAMEAALEKQDLSPTDINDAYRGLIDLLEGLDPNVEVALANSIWYREGLPVRHAFIDTNRAHFDAEVEALDFADPSASDRINGWVNDETRGNIEQIVPGRIPPDLVMYLINATYFNGPWRDQFDPSNTAPGPFHRGDGSTVSVPMMEKTKNVVHPTYQAEQFRAVDIAYGDSLYSMTILLPHEDASVQSVVDSLDTETWTEMTSGLSPQSLSRLKMPRFTLHYGKTLNDVLKDLGMGVAFTGRANFRDIADLSLAIDKAKHKTFLRVDEEGTEASAATSVEIGPISSAPPSFVLDRPFVVAIREHHSGTILFLGTVMDPTAG
ncbi:serpin family protein [Salinibacter ruber]|uniref:serpin family protein n=1 Tax=Salinibacter ruber TaxID=146919 RepID=UPI0021682074|nr:serpin family protein [Salinibacter ruber]MCS4048269.1 serpin B [Salinibacter ruber]